MTKVHFTVVMAMRLLSANRHSLICKINQLVICSLSDCSRILRNAQLEPSQHGNVILRCENGAARLVCSKAIYTLGLRGDPFEPIRVGGGGEVSTQVVQDEHEALTLFTRNAG